MAELSDKKCPKCSDHPRMNMLEKTVGLPEYLDQKPGQTQRINPSEVFPLEAYFCPKCRYVEFYAG